MPCCCSSSFVFRSMSVLFFSRTAFRFGPRVRAGTPSGRVGVTEQRWSTDTLVFDALPEVRAVLAGRLVRRDHARSARARRPLPRRSAAGVPASGYAPFLDGRPVGARSRYSRCDEPMPELTDELVAILPRDEYVDVARARARARPAVRAGPSRRTCSSRAATRSGRTRRRRSNVDGRRHAARSRWRSRVRS